MRPMLSEVAAVCTKSDVDFLDFFRPRRNREQAIELHFHLSNQLIDDPSCCQSLQSKVITRMGYSSELALLVPCASLLT